jgi:hypothetical protein
MRFDNLYANNPYQVSKEQLTTVEELNLEPVAKDAATILHNKYPQLEFTCWVRDTKYDMRANRCGFAA